MWTAVKIAGIVAAMVVTLAFLCLLVLVTRPAVLLGVSDSSLASSVNGGSTSERCQSSSGEWICPVEGVGAYRVWVDWMGCWKGVRVDDPSARIDGCIELGDIITFD